MEILHKLTTDEAKLVPAFSKGLLFFSKVDVFRTTRTDSRHFDFLLDVPWTFSLNVSNTESVILKIKNEMIL